MTVNFRQKKKKVSEDWLEAFPQLRKYGNSKFYKLVGPTLVGIELIDLRSGERYRPCFAIYSLCGIVKGAYLSKPIVTKPFYCRRGSSVLLKYSDHEIEFSRALKVVREKVPFALEEDVCLNELIYFLGELAEVPPLNAAPNSYLQARLLRSMLEIALWSGKNDLVKDIYDQIRKKDWDQEHFVLWGIERDDWMKQIKSLIVNRDQLLSQVLSVKQDKKLLKLLESKLIL